jgi:NADH-quinone oxidoreductase subunit C
MTAEWETRLEALPGAAPLTYVHNQWWMDAPVLDVRALAQTMLDLGVRLCTITGIAVAEGETQVIYHYAVPGGVLNVKVQTRGGKLNSITPITGAAAWAEREIQDLFGATFTGHPNPSRLIRPAQLAEGFFREGSAD